MLSRMVDALVLAGGVAKGAFGAGVLSVLFGKEGKAGADLDVRRVLATSSGALSGSFVAAILNAGTEEARIDELRTVWLEDASFGRAFEPSFHGILGLSGLSGEDRVLEILRSHMKPTPAVRDVELRVVVATLEGTPEDVGGKPATTFESVLSFDRSTFESAQKLEGMFQAVIASAAFPGAFVPVPLEVDGRLVHCIDGGAVNNAPLGDALSGEPEIDRLIVITPQPRVAVDRPSDLRGIGLAMHLGDVLTEERLFRDLSEAYATNAALLALEKVVKDPALRAQVVQAIGWGGRKKISIVELRPPTALAGNAFDGFFSRELREGYVRAGEEAARAWIAGGKRAGTERAGSER
jgi:predicted acylesterase/phospholipase RssA